MTPTQPAPLVRFENLGVRLGGVTILKGLNAAIPRGRITALIGLNGAGKTTLLRTLLKEVPYTGDIRFFCGHKHDQPFPEKIGYVPQRLQFDTTLPITVRELLTLALSRWPLFLGIRHATRQRIQAMLDRVWATKLIDYSVGSLSGGELQRVLLALAMEPTPEILLLDEPAAGIDFQHQDEFYQLIHRLNEETGVSVVLVSHELSVVSRFAHSVLCLNHGRVQCEGAPQEVLTGEMIQQIFGAEKALFKHHRHH
jgi:zinc transport system ATP-binding protein